MQIPEQVTRKQCIWRLTKEVIKFLDLQEKQDKIKIDRYRIIIN